MFSLSLSIFILGAISIYLSINISEGITYYIKNIHIIGLETVKEKYVMRELLFTIGELFNFD